jgi:carboxymethylenebutenolidase
MKRGNKKVALISAVLLGIVLLALIFSFGVSMEKKNVDDLQKEGKYKTVGEELNYYGNANGYFAKPIENGNFPGVIMIHEWWGLNENIKSMADSLASQGYFVLAVDLYGEVATESSRAGELAGLVRSNPSEAVNNMKAAISYLKQNTDGKIGSLGWCFGGQQSLQISLNESLDATVIYYGQLVTEETQLSKLNNPVLGIFGEEDGSIPVETVREFENSLNNLGTENDIYIYPGVGHAFANPSGANYAKEETKDAWAKTIEFLEKNLK